jgi:tRNA threonylcarbamoyladenosine biosynthesis protein TsaE
MISHSIEETHRHAATVARALGPVAPFLICLKGPLGAGKTEWARGFIAAYLKGAATFSPSYSVIHPYSEKKKKVFHVDLYRLKDDEDLESVGFWDLFREQAVILVEWPEKLGTDFESPVPRRDIEIKLGDDGLREILG